MSVVKEGKKAAKEGEMEVAKDGMKLRSRKMKPSSLRLSICQPKEKKQKKTTESASNKNKTTSQAIDMTSGNGSREISALSDGNLGLQQLTNVTAAIMKEMLIRLN
jgi:hypothetical protein